MKQTRKKLRYISLFSGIGGFEVGIHTVCPNAVCVGYSEVDKYALEVYRSHFNHPYLGSVVDITKKSIKKLVKEHDGIDLLVGGFPCQNLSSLGGIQGVNHGLDGKKSGLFWNMIQIISWIQKYNPRPLHIVVENNYSMSNKNKKLITKILGDTLNQDIHMNLLNGADFGVQQRRRLFWTTFNVDTSSVTNTQTWDDILLPLCKVQPLVYSDQVIQYKNTQWTNLKTYTNITLTNRKGNTYRIETITTNILQDKSRWTQGFGISSTTNANCRTIACSENVLLDCRVRGKNRCIPRHYHLDELHKLFGFPTGWVVASNNRANRLFGNAVITKKIEFVVGELLKHIRFF